MSSFGIENMVLAQENVKKICHIQSSQKKAAMGKLAIGTPKTPQIWRWRRGMQLLGLMPQARNALQSAVSFLLGAVSRTSWSTDRVATSLINKLGVLATSVRVKPDAQTQKQWLLAEVDGKMSSKTSVPQAFVAWNSQRNCLMAYI